MLISLYVSRYEANEHCISRLGKLLEIRQHFIQRFSLQISVLGILIFLYPLVLKATQIVLIALPERNYEKNTKGK
jgi:hypothetical protein